MLLFYPDICPYCKNSIDTSSKGVCSNLKCRSHIFYIGNLVIHKNSPGLGIGRISDVFEEFPDKKLKRPATKPRLYWEIPG